MNALADSLPRPRRSRRLLKAELRAIAEATRRGPDRKWSPERAMRFWAELADRLDRIAAEAWS